MKRFYFNDLRPLRLPFWITLILALALPFFKVLERDIWNGEAWSVLVAFIQLVYFGGISLLATLPFAIDFQYRTFPLLLSQPRSRSTIWRERTIIAWLCVGVCAALQFVTELIVFNVAGAYISDRFHFGTVGFLSVFGVDSLTACGFFLATACSACFWTLSTGSLIAGMVFTFAGEVLTTSIVYFAASAFTANEELVLFVMCLACPIYSALMLWQGWRKFGRLELSSTALADPAGTGELASGLKWRPPILRCTPTNSWVNLIRKEVRLHKPVFILTIAFIACWIVIRLLAALEPLRREAFDLFLGVMGFAYLPTVALLAGSVAICDEKATGLAAWQITFPMSALAQWFAKLGVALAVTFLCLLIPAGLEAMLPLNFKDWGDTAGNYWRHFGRIVVAFEVITIISFWAATLVEGAIRAIITTVAALGMFSLSIALGVWSADQFYGLQSELIGLYANFVPMAELPRFLSLILWAGGSLIVLGVLSLILMRAFQQFRYVQFEGSKFLLWCAVILFIGFLGAFWCADLVKSFHGGTGL